MRLIAEHCSGFVLLDCVTFVSQLNEFRRSRGWRLTHDLPCFLEVLFAEDVGVKVVFCLLYRNLHAEASLPCARVDRASTRARNCFNIVFASYSNKVES